MFSTFLGYMRREHDIFSFCDKFHSKKSPKKQKWPWLSNTKNWGGGLIIKQSNQQNIIIKFKT